MNRSRYAVSVCIVATFGLIPVCAAHGQDAQKPAEVIEIDKPGVLDKAGATYVLTKDVTAARTAFMIKGDGITLDLGGHTVTYGTDVGVDRCSGVFLRPDTGASGYKDFVGVPRDGFGVHFSALSVRRLWRAISAVRNSVITSSGVTLRDSASNESTMRCRSAGSASAAMSSVLAL